MRTFQFFVAAMLVAGPGIAGDVANKVSASRLKDWAAMGAAQKVSVAQDLAKDVAEKDRRVTLEKLASNIETCLDHLSSDAKYENNLLGAAYPECVIPAARDFQ